MKAPVIFLCLTLCLGSAVFPQSGKDQVYEVVQAYQANDQGQVLGQQPYNGRVILSANGSYKASLHIQDEGTWKLVKAGPRQPRDMIVFTSRANFQFYGYPQQDMMSLWLNRSPQGVSQWLTARLAGSKSSPSGPDASQGGRTPQPSQGGFVRGNVFSAVVLYSATSAPTYFRYDESTGRFSEDNKGIIFRPDGTYYLRAEFGDIIQEERGRYAISGSQVQLMFSDGSSLVLSIMEGGRKLHWYNSGMLLSEFYFLGTAR